MEALNNGKRIPNKRHEVITEKMEAPKPSGMGKPEHMEDGHIFEKDGIFLFNWKGGQCGYGSMEDAEQDLRK